MPQRIIIELDDEALAALEIDEEHLPHSAAGFLERTIASELNEIGLPDGGHVTAIFFVQPAKAKGGTSGWVRWGTDTAGVYDLRPDDSDPIRVDRWPSEPAAVSSRPEVL